MNPESQDIHSVLGNPIFYSIGSWLSMHIKDTTPCSRFTTAGGKVLNVSESFAMQCDWVVNIFCFL